MNLSFIMFIECTEIDISETLKTKIEELKRVFTLIIVKFKI